MATVTTARSTTGIPPRVQEKGVWCEVAKHTFAGEAAGEVVQAFKVASGTTVVDAYIMTVALGAGATLILGDGDDDNRYVTATTANTAGVYRLNNTAAGPYTYTADDTIDVTTAGGAATGAIVVVAFFTREEVDLT